MRRPRVPAIFALQKCGFRFPPLSEVVLFGFMTDHPNHRSA
jgi:hypothetical protein